MQSAKERRDTNGGCGETTDWLRVKAEYVTGKESQKDLATRIGVPYGELKGRASHEKWAAARRAYRENVVREATEKAQHAHARAIARQLDGMAEATELMAGHLLKALQDKKQFYRQIVQERTEEGATYTRQIVTDKADARAMRDLAQAVKELSTTIRNVYGIPLVTEKNAMEVAKERLKMDREARAESAAPEAVRVEVIGVDAETAVRLGRIGEAPGADHAG